MLRMLQRSTQLEMHSVCQVTATIVIVWLLVQLLARQRPHLAVALWILVLLKCITPPVLTSPMALFGMLPTGMVPRSEPADTNFHSLLHFAELGIASRNPPGEVDPLGGGVEVGPYQPVPSSQKESRWEEDRHRASLTQSRSAFHSLWLWWLLSAGAVLSTLLVRAIAVVRTVHTHRCQTPGDVYESMESLRKELGIRTAVRICVTRHMVGPAVVGLFRPTIILPEVILKRRVSWLGQACTCYLETAWTGRGANRRARCKLSR